MTRVLPLPGPARISSGPSVVVTAFFCGSLSPTSKSCCSNIVINLQKNINQPPHCTIVEEHHLSLGPAVPQFLQRPKRVSACPSNHLKEHGTPELCCLASLLISCCS